MSWQDRISNTTFTITTGDGKVFTPLWKSGETSKEYNASIYDFINLEGALVDRKKVKARKFPLVFWFQGEDNIEQADDFDVSANDSRAWTVRHPFYGDITGQPVSINRNDNAYNVTEMSVEFWESVTGVFPKKDFSITDQAEAKVAVYATIAPVDYSNKVNLKPADVVTVTDLAGKINALVTKVLDDVHYSDYQLAKNAMFAQVDNLILAPVNAMAAIQAVISLPAQFELSVSIRLNLFKAIYGSIAGLIPFNSNNKACFECQGGAVLGAMCLALVNPQDGDYTTRAQVIAAGQVLSDLYKDYLKRLDDAYVAVTDLVSNFAASQQTQNALQDLVIVTIANLNTLAFQAKQERTVLLDRDSNLILLTHKYMGLDADDVNLETFRQINGIKNRGLLQVKKGTVVRYYV